MSPTRCPRCGKVWNPATDDLVQLLNHTELHRWIDAGFKGKATFAVRTAWPDQRAAIDAWIARELEEMKVMT